MANGTAVRTVDRADENTAFAEIESVVATHSLASVNQSGHWTRAFMLAKGVERLRQLITPELMKGILPLFNTSLGFRADKETYPEAVVKDCLIEALLRGAYPVGNEFNIISGRCYLTKEFYMRALGELPGVTAIVASPGLPFARDSKTVVRYSLAWKRDGNPEQLLDHEGKPGRVFEIRVNAGMGADAIIGKATRKAYKAAYEQITGSQLEPDSELDNAVVIDAANGNGNSRKTSAAALLATASPDAPQPTSPGELADPDQLDAIEDLRDRHGKAFVAEMKALGKTAPKDLTAEEARALIDKLRGAEGELFGTAKETSAYG